MKSFDIIAAILSILAVLASACNSPDQEDIRDNYTGRYQVHETVSSYGFPECGEPYHSEKDTIISVTYGNTDTTLHVLGREVWLDADGFFYGYHYSLRLWKDSLSSYYMSGGLGCGSNIVHRGVRISPVP